MKTSKSDFIPFHKPSIETEEEEAVLSVLRSGWLTTGEKAEEFERVFADYVGANHAMAVNSATAGLFLSLKALNIQPNEQVITTPYTFISTAEVIEWCGAKPKFFDVDENTYNINPKNLKNLPYNSTIIPVHIAGTKCDMEKIYPLFPNGNIVEDCAHYFPSKFDERSTTAVYSFYSTKSITTGEGGMVVTNDKHIAERIKSLRYHGIRKNAWDRYTSTENNWYYEVHELGYKFNMSDIPAALGLVQLKRAKRLLHQRQAIAIRYNLAFENFDFIKTPVVQFDNTWHLYMIRLIPENLKIGRDFFIKKLTEFGIGVSVHFIPLHLMPYYSAVKQSFPVAERLYETSISLPIFPDMTDEQVEKVIKIVKDIGEAYHK